ncbi:hypothetical protein [Fluviispira multicolorata]|uniref:Uncharacterized protein n=1 Tax=Fluviispira multicolorata TaxID=2654512 RepID=A0A833JCC4_9BACT|nr:hypothetical protein [Fluviispira multicolorata]KAB8029178.1 hypothetical protein GCL57_11620 [Fluviispira multicolorata]
MKDKNIYDLHSFYIKNSFNEASNWERIEGVSDGQARFDGSTHCNFKSESPKNAKLAKDTVNKLAFTGAVRRVIKFLK